MTASKFATFAIVGVILTVALPLLGVPPFACGLAGAAWLIYHLR